MGEWRARLPIEAAGVISGVELELIALQRRPDHLVAVLLTNVCISRLCMGPKHWDRRKLEMIEEPHLHPWFANRPTRQNLQKLVLENYVLSERPIQTRDEAFAWFLETLEIDSPPWAPVDWPGEEGLF